MEVGRFIWNDAVTIGRNPIRNLDLIPCDIELLGEDLSRDGEIVGIFPSMQALRQNARHYMRERSFLASVIAEVSDRYDWVIIDCPPNLYLMTQNALHASDYYVVTAIPDHLSTIGLNILTRKVREIRGGHCRRAALGRGERAYGGRIGRHRFRQSKDRRKQDYQYPFCDDAFYQ